MESNNSNIVDVVINVRRVTKVTKGGKRFAFAAFVVSGDKQGRVGAALGKSREVSSAIAKATARARKKMVAVSLRGSTIPYPVTGQHGACNVMLRSAYKGTGIIAGGAVRGVMEAVGIHDVLAKSLGSANQINVVKATLNALAKLRSVKDLARLRGKTIEEVVRGSHVQA
ncbi:30S ribosomal protein S5 [candidate division TM6 bacterium RIFCSPHIGHO2_12_FULL_32_22]|nr:MAG: 30S ribosomal protein S5 [candidate division TM6 bacterium RIFCSPHIGHO2_12_FULL_32_22]